MGTLNLPFGPTQRNSKRGQRLLNCYAEPSDMDGEQVITLMGAPGISSWGTAASRNGCRGAAVFNGKIYAVRGVGLYEYDSAGNVSEIGIIPGSQRVSMAVTNTHLAICAEPFGYYMDKAGTLETITDGNFNAWGAKHVTSDSGFLLWAAAGKSQVWFSSPYEDASGPYDALAFGLSNKNGKSNTAILSAQSQVLVGCEDSIELWYPTGQTPFNYARNPTSVIDIGVKAKHTFIVDNLMVYFLGDDLSFYRLALGSIQPEMISKATFTEAVQGYGDVSDAHAYMTRIAGQHHVVITFPSAEATWLYSLNSGQWYERASYGQDRWDVDMAVEAFDEHILFQHDGPNTGILDEDVGQEWGNHLIRQWTYPVIASKTTVHAQHKRLWLDIDTGRGPLAQEHWCELEISNDGGETWFFGPRGYLGNRGEYGRRVQFSSLGAADRRAYRMTVSSNVSLKVRDTQLEVQGGTL